jgi:hypothetical protein
VVEESGWMHVYEGIGAITRTQHPDNADLSSKGVSGSWDAQTQDTAARGPRSLSGCTT